MELKILDNNVKIKYATEESAAFDLQASIEKPVYLYPQETKVIPSGLAINIDNPSIAALVMPRSGQSINNLVVANSPGLIDSDFQGEIGIIAHNNGNDLIVISPLERIAQLMFVPVIKPNFKLVSEFNRTTQRGEQGFGHSGE